MRYVKQLLREFWFPGLVATLWGIVGYFWGGSRTPPWVIFVKDSAGCFFLVSWATGQYFRVKKQSQVEGHLESILGRLSSVVKTIEEASEKSAALITGGESYCYVQLANMDPVTNRGLFAVKHCGAHPLYDVQIRVIDIDELQRIAEKSTTISLDAGSVTINLGTVFAGGITGLRGWSLGDGPSPRRYNIEIRARNGAWSQQMRVVKLADRWVTATRVQVEGQEAIEEAYDDYPKTADGSPVWE